MNQRPTCPQCGSDDVGAEATASWNGAEQKWTLADIYDTKFFCRSCDIDFCDPEWVNLSTPEAPVDNST